MSAPISITRISNLEFGTMVQGDSNKTISPGTSENPDNASFQISGNANQVYTISLPISANLTKAGGVDIILNNFTSFPPEGANGLLDNLGKQTLYIGATIASIPTNQSPGNYAGKFTVVVIY